MGTRERGISEGYSRPTTQPTTSRRRANESTSVYRRRCVNIRSSVTKPTYWFYRSRRRTTPLAASVCLPCHRPTDRPADRRRSHQPPACSNRRRRIGEHWRRRRGTLAAIYFGFQGHCRQSGCIIANWREMWPVDRYSTVKNTTARM